MSKDLLMKAVVGCGGQTVISHYTARRSPFRSVAGSTIAKSAASLSICSLPSITETEVVILLLPWMCYKSQAPVDRLILNWIKDMQYARSLVLIVRKPSSKSSRISRRRNCIWGKRSREGWLKPLLPSGDN